jgi:hypothetical protein
LQRKFFEQKQDLLGRPRLHPEAWGCGCCALAARYVYVLLDVRRSLHRYQNSAAQSSPRRPTAAA